MNENELLSNFGLTNALAALAAGVVLSIVFFKGLHYSVARVASGKAHGGFLLLSFFVRMAIVLAGFYWIGGSDWRMFVIMLISFVVTRFFVLRSYQTGRVTDG